MPYDCRCTFLSQDCSAASLTPVTEDRPQGWRKRFVLFPGCSVLLQKKDNKSSDGPE